MDAYSKPWARRTALKIEAGTMTKGDIGGTQRIIKNTLNGTNVASASESDIYALLQLIGDHKPRVTAEQSAEGMAWLRGTAYTPKGQRRNTDKGDMFSEADLRVLDTCTGFRLVAWELLEYGRWINHAAPVYRCESPLGSFDYYRVPWQSGDVFEIIRHA